MKPVFWIGAVILLIGAATYGGWTFIQGRALDDTSQALNLGSASYKEQVAAEKVFNTFVGNMRQHSYDQALKSTVVTYPSPHSTASLMDLAKTKLNPLVNGDGLQFEPVHVTSSKQKLYLRAQLHANGKSYGTVCTLSKADSGWLISDILPPIASQMPVVAHTNTIGAKQ